MNKKKGLFIYACIITLFCVSCSYPIQIETQQVTVPGTSQSDRTELEQVQDEGTKSEYNKVSVTERADTETVTVEIKKEEEPTHTIAREEDIPTSIVKKDDNNIGTVDGESVKPLPDAVPSDESAASNRENGEKSAAKATAAEGKNQEQEKTDEALELLTQSQNLWEKGNLEGALGLLDDAYALIIDLDGDPDISWQKDDLRYLIARRIMEIYTARSDVATGHQSEVPLVMNNDVQKEIERFKTFEKGFFVRSYKRSGRYRPMIVKKLKEAGLPEELSWLPLVESGFKINALSRARALGLWQFIPSTGYKFGLKRDTWIDERMDAEKATDAAIAYLKKLHEIFGDWYTVLASYNCGEGRVLKVISRQHMNYLDNFWDLYRQLPFETARYVPRFIATLQIIKDPAKFGIDLGQELDEPIPYETATIKKSMRLKDIATQLGVPESTLAAINTELRYKITPESEYDLKIPEGTGEQFASIIDKVQLAKKPGPAYVRHKVRRGESLSVIADRYRTSVRAIVALNHLRSRHTIRAGRWLKIPSRGYPVSSSRTTKEVVRSGATDGETIKYRVKKGDSLWLIARRFNTTISETKRLSGLSRSRLYVGQVITIRNGNYVSQTPSSTSSSKTYTVKRGDCLSVIAEKNRVSLAQILRLNNFNTKTILYPGQKIIVRE